MPKGRLFQVPLVVAALLFLAAMVGYVAND